MPIVSKLPPKVKLGPPKMALLIVTKKDFINHMLERKEVVLLLSKQ